MDTRYTTFYISALSRHPDAARLRAQFAALDQKDAQPLFRQLPQEDQNEDTAGDIYKLSEAIDQFSGDPDKEYLVAKKNRMLSTYQKLVQSYSEFMGSRAPAESNEDTIGADWGQSGGALKYTATGVLALVVIVMSALPR